MQHKLFRKMEQAENGKSSLSVSGLADHERTMLSFRLQRKPDSAARKEIEGRMELLAELFLDQIRLAKALDWSGVTKKLEFDRQLINDLSGSMVHMIREADRLGFELGVTKTLIHPSRQRLAKARETTVPGRFWIDIYDELSGSKSVMYSIPVDRSQ